MAPDSDTGSGERQADPEPVRTTKAVIHDIWYVLELTGMLGVHVIPHQEIAAARSRLLDDPESTIANCKLAIEQDSSFCRFLTIEIFYKREYELGILALEAVERALPSLVEREDKYLQFYLSELLKYAPKEWRSRILPFVRTYLRHWQDVDRSNPDEALFDPDPQLLGLMLALGDDRDVEEFSAFALMRVRRSNHHISKDLVSWIPGQRDVLLQPLLLNPERGVALLATYLSLDTEQASELVQAWRDSHPDKKKYVEQNLAAVIHLEEHKQGLTKTLLTRYGIMAFARYPKEILIEQHDDARDRRERPLGVVIFPRSDHNGAFYKAGSVLHELHRDLDGRYAIKVVEAENKQDIVKGVRRVMQDADSNQRVAFAVVGGHGTQTDIQFGHVNNEGGIDRPDHIYLEDLRDPRFQHYQSVFSEGATVVLVSCDTGQREGIAQHLSRTLGVSVIAPDRPTNLQSIRARIDAAGKLQLVVSYEDGEASTQFTAGQPIPKR